MGCRIPAPPMVGARPPTRVSRHGLRPHGTPSLVTGHTQGLSAKASSWQVSTDSLNPLGLGRPGSRQGDTKSSTHSPRRPLTAPDRHFQSRTDTPSPGQPLTALDEHSQPLKATHNPRWPLTALESHLQTGRRLQEGWSQRAPRMSQHSRLSLKHILGPLARLSARPAGPSPFQTCR